MTNRKSCKAYCLATLSIKQCLITLSSYSTISFFMVFPIMRV
ncbi:MAG: hypothetical protein SO118_07115 [Candidatus Onthomorpha sp.]|nr:hypothetical protein [Candidatus Onthomorpha sp.]